MSGWFSKAKNALSRPGPETPQPFLVSCECGLPHSGFRRQRHQRLICKTCGRSLFILPRDVYPQPRLSAVPTTNQAEVEDDLTEPGPVSIARLRKRTKGRNSSPQDVGNETVQPQESVSSRRPAAQGTTRRKGKKEEAPPPAGKIQLSPAAKLTDAGDHVFTRGFWSPFRIVAVCVVLVGVFTTMWMVRQSRLSYAAEVVRMKTEPVLALIQEEDWSSARQELESVVTALNQLGRTDPESQKLRQYSREIGAMTKLSSQGLDVILEGVRTEHDQLPQKSRKKAKLGNHLQGQWLVLEGVVRDVTPSRTRQRTYEISLPGLIAAGNGSAVVEVQSPFMDKMIPRQEERPLIFAGEILYCRHDEENNRWVIQLNPATAFLWSHPETYLGAGFEWNSARTEEAVLKQLESQAVVVGEAP
ncbi:MAG TPA: hypothetical protein VNQ76_19090 [Planctomicrobium sp.]|nr:hypothetical protein [Planctomicrobium sp.]